MLICGFILITVLIHIIYLLIYIEIISKNFDGDR